MVMQSAHFSGRLLYTSHVTLSIPALDILLFGFSTSVDLWGFRFPPWGLKAWRRIVFLGNKTDG